MEVLNVPTKTARQQALELLAGAGYRALARYEACRFAASLGKHRLSIPNWLGKCLAQ